MPQEIKEKKCDHIIAFHIGHCEITEKMARKDREILKDDCCGGVMLLNYCPLCGRGVRITIKQLTNYAK